MNNKWVAYLGRFPFPEGSAASIRVLGISKVLVELGYDVIVGSEGVESKIPREFIREEGKGSIYYIGLSEKTFESDSFLKKAFKLILQDGKRKVEWLNGQTNKPFLVFYYGSSSSFFIRLKNWCKGNNIPLIADVVEWRDGSHMPIGGMLSPLNISDKFCMRLLLNKSNGIIAISSYLDNYYKRNNSTVIRIPTLLETTSKHPSFRINNNKIRNHLVLAYAGKTESGKKDLLNNIIESLFYINKNGIKVVLKIVGPTSLEVMQYPSIKSKQIASVPKWMRVLGWQPTRKAKAIIKNSDFMPLLRPINRVSQAGFPTKFAESMALGTPVICNITSDLGLYIEDGINGFVCRDSSVESFVLSLEKAMKLSETQYINMRGAARITAEKYFDYHNYINTIDKFIEKVTLK